MAKLWEGRTDGAISRVADKFNSSISTDKKMYKEDITGSMAHAAMLGAKGIISKADAGTSSQFEPGLLSVIFPYICTGRKIIARTKETR